MVTLSQKLKLLRGLLTGEMAYGAPFNGTIDITRRCNLQCLGCRYHSPLFHLPSIGNPTILDISPNLIEKLCKELTAMGTKKMVFTGEGEPFLHPCLFDFISMAKAAGVQVTLFTNGTLLDEAKVQALIDSGLDVLIVSLWACSSEEYECNYPGMSSDHFRRVVNGLRLLSGIKGEQKARLPSVVLYHPINRNNFTKITEMVELGHASGCDTLYFSPFMTHHGELADYALTPQEEKFLYPSLVQIKKRLNSFPMKHNIDETLLRYRIGEAVWNKLPCYVGWFHTRVKVDGTVLSCGQCNLPLGSLQENTFQEIWNSPAYRTFRKQTLTRKGLASLSQHCHCDFCCFVKDNARVHRFFRWLSPFVLRLKH